MSSLPLDKPIGSHDKSIDKHQLRRRLRAQRRALSSFAQHRAARHLLRRAAKIPWFIRARTLALYLAADGEIDPRPLLEWAWRNGKQVYLPSLRRGNRLAFVEYRADMPLARNRFGIPEPYAGIPVLLSKLDVICLPLVGFDRGGGRLGMGGGFYDRTLARTPLRRPRLVGLAHSLQECAQLPREAWDIALDGVLTEREWIRAERF